MSHTMPNRLRHAPIPVEAEAPDRAFVRRGRGRRPQSVSTTGVRDASTGTQVLMAAMEDYKVRTGRMFPTWSEVLEVLRGLGAETTDPGVSR